MSEADPRLEESLAPRSQFPIQLPSFEGPLDLLLFLIRRNEIDIYDIPVEEVTRQYLDILAQMERMDLEVAGDFFVMAATLMYVKSRMLLPVHEAIEQPEEEEDELDPRWELVQQLLEYKKFKEASELVRRKIEVQNDYLPRQYRATNEVNEARPLKPTDRIELWNTFNVVLRRIAEKMRSGEIHDEQVTVAERMEDILDILDTRERFSFEELLTSPRLSINYVVSTFLALLELARLKRLDISQDEAFGEIWCDRRDASASEHESASD